MENPFEQTSRNHVENFDPTTWNEFRIDTLVMSFATFHVKIDLDMATPIYTNCKFSGFDAFWHFSNPKSAPSIWKLYLYYFFSYLK